VQQVLRLSSTMQSYDHDQPFTIARGSETTATTIRVDVTGGHGVGEGEASPLARYDQHPDHCLETVLALDGRISDDPDRTLDDLDTLWPVHEQPRAGRAALEVACHDYVARAAGLPLWRHLGLGRPAAATSMTISLGTPEEMAAAAARFSSTFRSLKVKLGSGDGQDLDRLRAVRAATMLPLCVDVNEWWSFDESAAIVPLLADFGVTYLEQPLIAGHRGMADLADLSSVPLIADEEFTDVEQLGELTGCFDGVNVKIAKVGGIRPAMRAVSLARQLGLSVVIGCMNESALGISPAVHLASMAKAWDVDGHLLLRDAPWQGLGLSDGIVTVSDGAGLGVRSHAEP
jgi:L-alanine-DL-glutamate epimerase-like enolase superfamily enzyme